MSSSLPNHEEKITPVSVFKKKAAVVDDAFDNVDKEEVRISDYLEFYQVVNEFGAFDEIIQELGLEPPIISDDDSSEELASFLQKLWEHRDEPKLRQLLVDGLFADKFSKLSSVESICQNLEKHNLTVERFGSRVEDYSIFSSGEFVYIFIDYNLGYKPGKEAIENAKKKVKAIYDACPDNNKPITILMSSMPEVAAQKDKFQIESGMVEGVFRFSAKDALINADLFKLLVRAYKEEFEKNHSLQNYINSLAKAANEALEIFQKEVRMLRIDDYVFIQNSALLDQAQPLGDYLAWLYGSHWANLLLRNSDLKKQQSVIDKVLSRTPPLHHEIPSTQVSDIYMSALFEDELSPIAYHPLESQGPLTDKPTSALAKLPYLHLGDLFTKKDETIVWMVLNAQCDLERANEAAKERSIFLVQGVLHKLNKIPLEAHYKTEFFKFNGNQYRIAWEVKKVLSIPHNEFEAWQKQNNYERHHRLRLPFALEIQQAFSASVTRVGLPVSPPFAQDLRLEVVFRAFNGSVGVLLQSNSKYAFQPVTRKEDKFVRLTLAFALDFKDALNTKKVELMKQLLEVVSSPKMAEQLAYISDAVSNVEKLIDKFEDLFFEKKGFKYPDVNKCSEAFKGQISVCVDIKSDVFPKDIQSFFIFNIITKSAPKVEQNTLNPSYEPET